MSIPIDYDKRVLCKTRGNPPSNRPLALISLVGRSRTWHNVMALIDTGADYSQLPNKYATGLGIDLNGPDATKMKAQMADGSVATMTLVDKVSMIVEGKPIKTQVMFSNGFIPLIGRVTITKAMVFGLDSKGWLHKV